MRNFNVSVRALLGVTTVAILGTAAVDASAGPNLVANGSFEGTNGLAGFSIGGTTGDPYLPVAIKYNQASGYPTGAQNESVPTDNAPSASPDGAGQNGVYFVSDRANQQSVYQYVFLKPGSYDIGFDSYATFNGYAQPGDSRLTANIAGVQLASFLVSAAPAGVWVTHAGEALVTKAGEYLVSFAFDTSFHPDQNSKDVVIDRAYVVADPKGGGTPISTVAEPATLSLMFGAVGLVGMTRRSRKDRATRTS